MVFVNRSNRRYNHDIHRDEKSPSLIASEAPTIATTIMIHIAFDAHVNKYVPKILV